MMNYYNVSTQEALKAGRMNLKYIPAAFMYAGGLGVLFFIFRGIIFNNPEVPRPEFPVPLVFFALPFVGIALGTVWRNLHSAAWKIWALENVRDAHRLYQLAVNEGMIYERGSWLNILEYKSYDQKERLAELEMRLEKPREFDVPDASFLTGEQSITYSTNTVVYQAVTIAGFFAVLYFFSQKNGQSPLVVLIIPVVFAGYLLIRQLRRMDQPAPIRFDVQQLTLSDNPPVAWKAVTNIFVDVRREGKSSSHFLVVERSGGPNLEIKINDLEGSPAEIEDTLYQYWALAKKASKPS